MDNSGIILFVFSCALVDRSVSVGIYNSPLGRTLGHEVGKFVSILLIVMTSLVICKLETICV